MHGRSIPAPTKAERIRMAAIVERGCVACLTEHDESLNPVEVHHLLDGGVRRGHRFTVALCRYHHRGIPPDPLNQREAENFLGPNLYHDGKGFHARFGDDDELLAFQESILRH